MHMQLFQSIYFDILIHSKADPQIWKINVPGSTKYNYSKIKYQTYKQRYNYICLLWEG